MISFAGGLPAPETFPEISLAGMPASCLQYGASEGDPELRQAVADNLNALGLACTPAQVLILSGSQQGIDLVAKLFIDAGTPVAVESPTYLAALQVFRYFGAKTIRASRCSSWSSSSGRDTRCIPPAPAPASSTHSSPGRLTSSSVTVSRSSQGRSGAR